MIAAFSRSTGDTLEVDDDGTFRVVRWSGATVGRFAGLLAEERAAGLRQSVDSAAGHPKPERTEPWPSEVTVETLYGSDSSVLIELTVYEDAPQPWASAVSMCRELMEEVVSQPEAAVGIELSGPPLAGVLRHLGTAPMTVYLDGADVEAAVFRSDGGLVGSWRSKLSTGNPAAQDLTPGWEQDLGLQSAGLSVDPGNYCQVQVTFTVYEGLPRQAQLTATLP